jgi:hypothetical protein
MEVPPLDPDEAARAERFSALTSETLMMSPLDTVRSVLRDPLHRNERLQAPLRSSRALLMVLAPLLGVVAAVLGLVLPALWTAESIIREREGMTLESLLLTPVDRQRVIWAKVLARLRPLRLLAYCCPVVGAILGGAYASDSAAGNLFIMEKIAVTACIGAVIGSLAGVELLAFGFTAGAAGILAALKPGGRIVVMLRALLYEAILLVCNGVLLGIALIPAAALYSAPIVVFLLLLKWLFFNWRSGASLIDTSSALMDKSLLKESA